MPETEPDRPLRLHTRDDVREIEISDEREAQLREAFEHTVAGNRIQNCVAASFEIDGDISDSGVVVSSRLDADRIFQMVSSYSGGNDPVEGEVFASATVKDVDTDRELASHVTKDKILISRKEEDVSFESFRDYVLFLEHKLHVTLTPIAPE